MTLYRIARAILEPILWVYFKMQVYGRENLARDGAFVLVGNHRRLIDPVIVGIVNKRPTCFMAKAELFSVPVLKTLLKWIRVFPVNRKSSDVKAIKTALGHLKEGRVVGIFPEGMRVREKEAELENLQGGAAMIALKAEVDVIPVYIEGPYSFRGGMRVVVGKSISLAAFRGRRVSQEDIGQVSALIQNDLKEMRNVLMR